MAAAFCRVHYNNSGSKRGSDLGLTRPARLKVSDHGIGDLTGRCWSVFSASMSRAPGRPRTRARIDPRPPGTGLARQRPSSLRSAAYANRARRVSGCARRSGKAETALWLIRLRYRKDGQETSGTRRCGLKRPRGIHQSPRVAPQRRTATVLREKKFFTGPPDV